MKLTFKIVSAFLVMMLVLAAFPTMKAHAACYNAAWFVADKAPLDGIKFTPGDTFSKSWVVQNVGTCTWDTSYQLVNVDASGDPFGVTTSVPFTSTVGRWGTITLTVSGMKAPATPGIYQSNWMLSDGTVKFGVGRPGGGVPIFVKIKVVAPPAVTYNFADKAASATWTGGNGTVPFGHMPGSIDGSAIVDSIFKLEDGKIPAKSILFTSDSYPRNAPHYIQAEYPDMYHVNSGDRFQATVGCESTAGCHVSFSLQYRFSPGGTVYTLGTYLEKHEGLTRKVDMSLNSLAGKNVQLILRAYNYRYPAGDGASAIWGDPVIVGTGTSSGPSTSGWNTYMDSSAVPFTFMYPSGSSTDFANNKITLSKGTSTIDKTLEIRKPSPGATPAVCLSGIPNPPTTPTIFKSSKGIEFNKEESATGDKWIAYTATHADPAGGSPSCVSLAFKLSSSGTSADLAVLETIVNTLEFK